MTRGLLLISILTFSLQSVSQHLYNDTPQTKNQKLNSTSPVSKSVPPYNPAKGIYKPAGKGATEVKPVLTKKESPQLTKTSPTKSTPITVKTPAPTPPKNVVGKGIKGVGTGADKSDDFNRSEKSIYKPGNLESEAPGPSRYLWCESPGKIINEDSTDFHFIKKLKSDLQIAKSEVKIFKDTSALHKPKSPFETTLEYKTRRVAGDSVLKELIENKINPLEAKLNLYKNRYMVLPSNQFDVKIDSMLYNADYECWELILQYSTSKIEELGLINIPKKVAIMIARNPDKTFTRQLISATDSSVNHFELEIQLEGYTNQLILSRNQCLGISDPRVRAMIDLRSKSLNNSKSKMEVNKGMGVGVTQGNRKITKTARFDGDMRTATIFARIKVSPEGKGSFVEFAKGSTQMTNQYKQAVIQYLGKIQFDASDKEDIVVVQFNFIEN